MTVNKNSKEYRIAKELAEMYVALKQISARIQELVEEYDMEELEGILVEDIKKIEECDHSLLGVANRIAKEKVLQKKKRKK